MHTGWLLLPPLLQRPRGSREDYARLRSPLSLELFQLVTPSVVLRAELGLRTARVYGHCEYLSKPLMRMQYRRLPATHVSSDTGGVTRVVLQVDNAQEHIENDRTPGCPSWLSEKEYVKLRDTRLRAAGLFCGPRRASIPTWDRPR
ncbi:hypothetical protein C8T65DRAFT_208898 [Cerioporus squamosus]|nr:hypothetical protein C8T65DRAFT_208898 [Cerioporus squamosus]